ncbi:hypothetical protein FB479_102151 [Brevibacillus sp. AG162]|uniref:hypothetical protein n=1 Tax=Brevibacillus sp. AG162 TaxID=2572910 RepID=UPI0011528604|nr:hypothetical protein [Brevibacillus sp. AG162]TQK73522.1 hypothetical protein FB479_102151 [Brevibacillus sp. AG162]
MKLKKLISTIGLTTCLLSMSSSAFAMGDAREPDSRDSPNYFQGIIDSFEGTIAKQEYGMDQDFFRWTNNTGQGKTFYINFDTYQNRSLDYQIFEIDHNGQAYQVFKDTGRETWFVYLPANGDIRIKVGAQDAIRVDPNVKYIISLSERPWWN